MILQPKPAKVPKLPPRIDYEKIRKSLSLAHAAVGELRGVLTVAKSTEMLVAPFRKREAVSSSAIEGTRATLEEVMEFEALDNKSEQKSPHTPEEDRKRDDILEVINYENALNVGARLLKERPLGEVLLKKTHSELLRIGRGEDKDPGNFRRIPVAVGDYIPPVFGDISELMANWENYTNNKENIEDDPLIRIGVAHYQFEAIHPFKDGNGRMGRLIIPLFLCQEGILHSPVLYISDYFEQNKKQYLHLLHKVDTDQAWEEWLNFFFAAVEVQARITAEKARSIMALYESLKKEIVPGIKSRYAIAVLDLLFEQPIISAKQVKEAIKVSGNNMAYNLIEKFELAGILHKGYAIRREQLYIFRELFNIVNA